MALAGTSASRGIRILRRSIFDIPPSATPACCHHHSYSSVPENEVCATAAVEQHIKKTSGKAKKTIAERVMAAVERIHERGLPPELRRGGSIFGNATNDPIRAEADIVNVAEQRIVQSMLNGDFENLPGKGKPLKLTGNPHANAAEDMAYRILASNGFAPEWVQLNKEIRFLIQKWRASLNAAHSKKVHAIGDASEAEIVTEAWNCALKQFELELKDINRKVLSSFFLSQDKAITLAGQLVNLQWGLETCFLPTPKDELLRFTNANHEIVFTTKEEKEQSK